MGHGLEPPAVGDDKHRKGLFIPALSRHHEVGIHPSPHGAPVAAGVISPYVRLQGVVSSISYGTGRRFERRPVEVGRRNRQLRMVGMNCGGTRTIVARTRRRLRTRLMSYRSTI
jgi:hypothetical protein